VDALANRKITERRVSRPSSVRDARIAARYIRGDLITSIAFDEEVDVKTVRNVARRMGLPRRRPDRSERNLRVAARYRAGEPVLAIAEDEGVHPKSVGTVAKRAGVPPRRGWQRVYPIDETAFDQPTEIGWWLVGLLAADGCVFAREHRISLAQNAGDQDVLNAFLAYVGSPGRPLASIAPGHFEARIFSRRVCEALARYGVVPRKSKSLELSPEAADQAAVWLGLFDGDGSAGVKLGHGRPRIDFFGAPPVMKQCSEFWGARLKLATNAPPTVVNHAGGLKKVSIYGANAARGARIMLASSPISHQRKRRTLEAISLVRPSKYDSSPHRLRESEIK
jgi:hypothetical protein